MLGYVYYYFSWTYETCLIKYNISHFSINKNSTNIKMNKGQLGKIWIVCYINLKFEMYF